MIAALLREMSPRPECILCKVLSDYTHEDFNVTDEAYPLIEAGGYTFVGQEQVDALDWTRVAVCTAELHHETVPEDWSGPAQTTFWLDNVKLERVMDEAEYRKEKGL